MKAAKSNRRLLFLLFAVIGVILLLIVGIYANESYEEHQLDKEALLYHALADINDWRSYRYTLDASILLNNGQCAETKLKGEVDINGDIHAFGELLDTAFEVYQCGENHFRYEKASKSWLKLENSPLTAGNPLTLMMIDPKRNCCFTDIISVKLTDKTREQGKIRYLYTIIPKEGYHLADAYFSDFRCDFSIEPEGKRITDAAIYAASRHDGKSRLEMQIHFSDVNRDFTLDTPKTED